ncbi:MAG TPA: sensor domain-containing diguanylate cyclase [Longimicrobiaceae bacterium]|nr:sensor domain-containing diguanylate cyclase [Longimicrobiaceae bacterium]
MPPSAVLPNAPPIAFQHPRAGRLLWFTAFFYAVVLAAWALETARGAETLDVGWALLTLVILIYGALSLAALRRQPGSPQVAVFVAAGISISLTIVWPLPDLDLQPRALLLALLLPSSLVYTLPVALLVHLAALIPRPHPVAVRHRWFIPAAYAVAALLGLASFVPYANALAPFLPWEWSLQEVLRYDAKLNYAGNLLAGVTCIALLQHAARRDASPEGRRQALVVLLAFVPWTMRQLRRLTWEIPAELEEVLSLLSPISILLVALGFFVAIAGFQLFNLGLVVRRSAVYGLTVGVLAAAAWFGVILAGGVAVELLGLSPEPWSAGLLFVAAGIAFQPLARRIGHAFDAFFYREKLALARLQRTLIPDLAELREPGETAARLVERLVEGIGIRSAALVTADERRRFYRAEAVAGEAAAGPGAREAVVKRGDLDALWPGGRRRPVERRAGGPAELARMLDLLHARWIVPVEFRGDLTGVLTLGEVRSGAGFDQEDFERMEVLAQEVSAMLENARLFGLATRDPLTGLPHRRVFEERLALELERARRSWRPFAVGMADVDDFKAVNDRFGHVAGDRVLRAVGASLAGLGRGIDVVARWGGEEFAFLLPETDGPGARTFGERLREGVELACARFDPPVTLSVGVYVLRPDDAALDADELVRRADRALYQAKRDGKNRVSVDGDAASALAGDPNAAFGV